MRDLNLRLTGIVLTPIVTAAGYFCWLGWHRPKHEQPDGSLTGPYTAWQVIGFIATLAVITVAITWWCKTAWIAPIMTTIATTAYFSADAATSSDNDGLWPIGAALVMIGTAVGTAVGAWLLGRITRVARRRSL